uniref:Uncharacterized protein n=1 Tax=viral metagenome TaxID=1070528 RepID=A0A6M3JMY9_9ZZZZ
MRKLTEEEARKIICPKFSFKNNDTDYIYCSASKCFAWYEVDPKIEREDHSGANENMLRLSVQRNQRVKRTGPIGCLGLLTLEAQGTCIKLYNIKGE